MVTHSTQPQQLVRSIEQRIMTRTHGRIRGLEVEIADESVVLRGRTSTYYAKQLAQHGALEILADQPILNAIQVG